MTLVLTILICVTPIFELRGGIPFAVANGISPVLAGLICVAANWLASPLAYLFLNTIHRFMDRFAWYRNVAEKFLERARKRVKTGVDKYGYWGLALFVAVPLPVTGAYTGVLGAWILGMDWKKSIAAISAGVLIAGVIVTLVVAFGVEALSLFVKEI